MCIEVNYLNVTFVYIYIYIDAVASYSNRIHYYWICRIETTGVQLMFRRNELLQLYNKSSVISEHIAL